MAQLGIPIIDPDSVAKGAQFAATYTGTAAQIQPLIDALPPGTEYSWIKTDGSGTLLDIITEVAA